MNVHRFLNKAFFSEIKYNLKKVRIEFSLLLIVNTLFSLGLLLFIMINRGFSNYLPSEFPKIDVTAIIQTLSFSIVLYCVIGFFLVMRLFHYLHNDKSLDLYHTIPISRNQLMASRFIAISIILAGATFIQTLLLIIFQAIMASSNLSFHLGSVVLCLISSYITALAVISIFIFCAICSSGISTYILYSVSLNIFFPFAFILLLRMVQQTVAGFYINDSIAGYFIPAANIGLIASGKGNPGLQIICMLIIIFAMLWITGLVYKSSERENLESHFSVRLQIRFTQLWVQIFCIAFFSFLMELLLLGGYSQLKIFRENPIYSVLIALPVSLILTLIIEAFSKRKRQFKRAMIQWTIVMAFAVIFGYALQTGLFNSENYVPDIEEIEHVTFSDNCDNGDSRNQTALAFESLFEEIFNNRFSAKDLIDEPKTVELYSPESIEAVLQLHKESLEFFHKPSTRDLNTTYTITYYLKSGKKVSRTLQYSNNTLDIKDESRVPTFIHFDYKSENVLIGCYRQVLLLNEYLEKSNPLFVKDTEDLLSIYIYPDNVTVTDKEFLQDIVAALREDLRRDKSLAKSNSIQTEKNIQLCFRNEGCSLDLNSLDASDFRALLTFYNMGNGENALFDYYTFNIPVSYTSTLLMLSKLDYT